MRRLPRRRGSRAARPPEGPDARGLRLVPRLRRLHGQSASPTCTRSGDARRQRPADPLQARRRRAGRRHHVHHTATSRDGHRSRPPRRRSFRRIRTTASSTAAPTPTRTRATSPQGGYVPRALPQITYVIKSVQTWTDTSVDAESSGRRSRSSSRESGRRRDDVVFNTPSDAGTVELMPNFVGSPSVYFAWAVPQDGIADAGRLQRLGERLHQGRAQRQGRHRHPDRAGQQRLLHDQRRSTRSSPPSATMLTGGVGYTYSLTGDAAADRDRPRGVPVHRDRPSRVASS